MFKNQMKFGDTVLSQPGNSISVLHPAYLFIHAEETCNLCPPFAHLFGHSNAKELSLNNLDK